MSYNINIREEIFGATVNNLKIGKREYINKRELNDVLEKGIFPKELLIENLNEESKIKFTALEDKYRKTKCFSFADIAFIELTRECNLRCKHCLNYSGVKLPHQMSDEELVKLITDLAEAGVQEIRFTGGEPLLYEKIFKLINLSSKLGLYTSIGTNGTLITKSIAEKMKTVGLRKVVVSLDGTKDMHDLIRGKGNFDKTIKGLSYLKEYDIQTRVNAVIMHSNIQEVITLAKELHNNETHLFIRRFIESGRGINLRNNMLSEQDYNYVREQLKEELNTGPYINGHYLRNDEGVVSRIKLPFEIKGCKAGQRALAIMPDGEINLCGFLAAQGFNSVGNIREIKDWRKFWNGLHQFDRLEHLRNNLDRYNSLPNVQNTYCLAYIQRYISKEKEKC